MGVVIEVITNDHILYSILSASSVPSLAENI
jgi:hypothetical protein